MAEYLNQVMEPGIVLTVKIWAVNLQGIKWVHDMKNVHWKSLKKVFFILNVFFLNKNGRKV